MARYRVETDGGNYEVETEDAPALPPSVLDPKPPAKSAGQATSDFLGGAWSMASPVTAVQGLAQAVMHPIDTAAGIVQAHADTAGRAAVSMKQGDYLQGVRHALNTIIPLIGPMLDQSQEKVRSGNTAEGLGEIVGMAAAPAVLRGTAAAAGKAAQGAKAAVGAVRRNPALANAALGTVSPRAAAAVDVVNEIRAMRNPPPAAPRPGAAPPPAETWDYSAPPQAPARVQASAPAAVPETPAPAPVAEVAPLAPVGAPAVPAEPPYVPVDPAAGLDPAIYAAKVKRRNATDARELPPEMRQQPAPAVEAPPAPDPLGVRPLGDEAAGLADIPATGAEKIKRARARVKAKEAESFDARLQKLVERSRKMEPEPEAKAAAGVAEEAPPKFKGEPKPEPTDAKLADALQRSLDEVHARKLSHRTGVPAASTPEGAPPAKLVSEVVKVNPKDLTFSESGQSQGPYLGDPTKPIAIRSNKEIIDGHHRAIDANKSGRTVDAIVIPEDVYQRFKNDGIHPGEMLREYARLRGDQARKAGGSPAPAARPAAAPAAGEDMTALLQQSLDAVNDRKGGAAPVAEAVPEAPPVAAVPESAPALIPNADALYQESLKPKPIASPLAEPIIVGEKYPEKITTLLEFQKLAGDPYQLRAKREAYSALQYLSDQVAGARTDAGRTSIREAIKAHIKEYWPEVKIETAAEGLEKMRTPAPAAKPAPGVASGKDGSFEYEAKLNPDGTVGWSHRNEVAVDSQARSGGWYKRDYSNVTNFALDIASKFGKRFAAKVERQLKTQEAAPATGAEKLAAAAEKAKAQRTARKAKLTGKAAPEPTPAPDPLGVRPLGREAEALPEMPTVEAPKAAAKQKAASVGFGKEISSSSIREFDAFGLDDGGKVADRLKVKQEKRGGMTWRVEADRGWTEEQFTGSQRLAKKQTEVLLEGASRDEAKAFAKEYLTGDPEKIIRERSGFPMTEYSKGTGATPKPTFGRFGALGRNGAEEWHTDGHFAMQGKPPKNWGNWRAEGDMAFLEGKPEPLRVAPLESVMPKSPGSPVEPVGFASSRSGRLVFFSDGTAISAKYYDAVVKGGVKRWSREPSKKEPVQGYDASGKRIALVMPVTTEEIPQGLQALVKKPATRGEKR